MVVPDCLPDRDSTARPKVVIADTDLPGVPQASFFRFSKAVCKVLRDAICIYMHGMCVYMAYRSTYCILL